MGRTVPTFRQLIDDAIARWSKFRRALRREDQEYFDRLFRRVRIYTQAATYQASDNPMEAILLTIAIDQEKRLDALEHAAMPPEANMSIALAQSEESPAQLDAHEGPDKNEQPERQLHTQRDTQSNTQPDTRPGIQPGKQLSSHQQLSFDQRMDFRSLPEPARNDAVADRPEPDTPPAD
jgi:hypothetical protein